MVLSKNLRIEALEAFSLIFPQFPSNQTNEKRERERERGRLVIGNKISSSMVVVEKLIFLSMVGLSICLNETNNISLLFIFILFLDGMPYFKFRIPHFDFESKGKDLMARLRGLSNKMQIN